MARSRTSEFVTREAPVIEIDERQRTAVVAISAEVEDDYQSIVVQRGLRYDQNLPVMVGHDRSQLPVARASRIWLGQDERGTPTTFARLTFPPSGQVYAADEAYQAVRSGLANSVSIGFFLDKVTERSDGLLQIDEARVAEVSLVSVAANSRARVLDVNAPAGMETRQPQPHREPTYEPPAGRSLLRTIYPAPAIAERKTDLTRISFFDFVAMASPDVQRETTRDLGPAAEWVQELNREAGSEPSRGVRFPLGLMYHRATPERDRELHKRQGEALMTETLMRQMLADFADAMRREAFFGALGVPTPMASELNFIVPSVATRPLRSAWIGKDQPATPGVIPTFVANTATPHTLSTLVVIPRSMLLYTGGLAEQVIRQDISAAHLDEMQQTYLYGSSATNANQPDGIMILIPASPAPAAPTVAERTDLWSFISPIENAPLGDHERNDLRWFMPKKYARQLQKTPLFPDADRRSDDTVIAPDVRGGSVLGTPLVESYPAVISNHLHSALGAANDQVDLLFGSFLHTWWVSWQNAIVMSNPYSSEPTGFRAGGLELLILRDHDLKTRDVKRIVRSDQFQHTIP